MLKVKGINVYYDQIHALKDVSLEVRQGELVALLGANGAGKTTTLRTLSGLLKPKSGSIEYMGKEITSVPAHKIVSMGMAHSPEGRQVFAQLTVLENLRMGAYTRPKSDDISTDIEWIYSLFPVLKQREKLPAGALSGGEQQMLAMGRALMSKPSLLLLDEPSLGLAPIMVEKIFEVIQLMKKSDITVLLVEQNAYESLLIADRAYVLETGSIKLEGPAEELLHNSDIQKAYLGG
ncbi:ABC transporter ATP-binding protein [Paenibacillus sp. MB22_1]|jgi:branched-chain amino acid transport system ATP-binding protein|uniref:ABC transporter ATP-binding protein n=1 Tax=Paenibacillus TaxID=44249 RepID=UPI0028FDAB81|nr:ABC transporter ATP-binding protein [Paenibacillus sp. 3LSP]MDU0332887.1 ABC transporter ATP-binding protein [Paenibacillus sp. 3LSP]